MSVNGDWGILKTIPISADYNRLINDQTVLGMNYLDCSNQTLSQIDFKIKRTTAETSSIYIINMWASLLFVKVADE